MGMYVFAEFHLDKASEKFCYFDCKFSFQKSQMSHAHISYYTKASKSRGSQLLLGIIHSEGDTVRCSKKMLDAILIPSLGLNAMQIENHRGNDPNSYLQVQNLCSFPSVDELIYSVIIFMCPERI